MIKQSRRWLWAAGIAASLGLSAGALGQSTERSGFQPLKNLFGSKTPAAVEVQVQPAVEAAHRTIEIMVELAWLGDPGTFPYFLEAKSNGQSMEVRGYVPSRAVRAQAL